MLKRLSALLSCNKPKNSNQPGKEWMVKACARGETKIIHFNIDRTLDQSKYYDRLSRKYWESGKKS